MKEFGLMKFSRLSWLFVLGAVCLFPAKMQAGSAPVLDSAPPDSGIAPAAVDIPDTDGGFSIQPFVFDGTDADVSNIVGNNAAPPGVLGDQVVPGLEFSGLNDNATPEAIATSVAASVRDSKALTITLVDGSIQVTPSPELTALVATYTDGKQINLSFAGMPSVVNQSVATATALTVAKATPETTQAGTAIAATGAPAAGVVNLMLGFQNLVGNPATAALSPSVLVASTENVPVLARGLTIDPQQLSRVIATYNQLVMDCPEASLQALASNPEFQAIGKALRQMRGSGQ
jgi:hypothetical protein